MALYSAVLTPGKSLGIFSNIRMVRVVHLEDPKKDASHTLGQSLYEITTRIKAEPKVFTKQDITASQDEAATKPIILALPDQGIRLRFDGPEQRLRLIEVTDFSKNTITYKDQDIASKPTPSSPPRYGSEASIGPSFKHIYSKAFGPTFPGEFLPTSDIKGYGTYTLSYPGIAFNFPVTSSAWSPHKDFAAILSSPAALPASSLAIFSGASWPDARPTLFTAALEDPKLNSPNNKEKLAYPDDIGMVHILGSGQIRMDRAYNASHFWLQLGETTPQELVAELGPPDAIYRKSDPHLSIHKARGNSGNSESTTHSHPSDDAAYESHDDSSSHSGSAPTQGETPNGSSTEPSSSNDDSEGESSNEDETTAEDEDCFYNYFHQGFDILISRPVPPSQEPPSTCTSNGDAHTPTSSPDSKAESKSPPQNGTSTTSAPLVATKLILHGNISGTYAFGRHRRIRWKIPYLSTSNTISSESPFPEIAESLEREWRGVEASNEERRMRMRGMVLNRGWGESVGSSMEVLGNWEEGGRAGGRGGATHKGMGSAGGKGAVGTSVLYGWPGLVFEVGRGGVVGGLTVF